MLRLLASIILLFHFTALTLNNLPWSDFIASLYPYYSWYIYRTGQAQNWALYNNVLKSSPNFELELSYADGRTELPWGTSRQMASRSLYFLEAVLIRRKMDGYGDRFLQWFWDNAPEGAKPSAARLSHYFTPIPEHGIRETAGITGPPAKQYRKTW